ncbi:alpha/beta hydrolase [Streptomyces sp. WMMC1477]|uniref:alpha/beta hydrolase n=1 Tax=Streptomyces sp. WMMC1477 TaxID=3015155 RepID=UPI0022B616D5|nr:alpha/beta hydrolase [Streptomyces sp. WMMC1477]MCZ7433137.1 alpha/beta hydrolase [Streptomyces sp. WMMC1477]
MFQTRTKRARRRAAAVAAATALALTALAGCSDDGDAAGDDTAPSASTTPSKRPSETAGNPPPLPEALTGQKLSWEECGSPAPGRPELADRWECADMKAPLDYDKPDGETLDIALIRTRATEDDRRVGSLLFNFGGPGGSGVATLPNTERTFSTLNTFYDLVSFDPRGVGRSSKVRCQSDAEIEESLSLDLTPDTAAEEKEFLDDAKALSADCERKAGKVLPHVGTSDAARDMDLMRHLLGDEKLHYLGFSYGTSLGGTYAHLFPGNVGRMVLDAAVDPTAGSVTHAKNQALGFQRALENYLRSTGEDPAKGTKRITALLERIDEDPLPTSSGRELTEGQALYGLVTPLYSKSSWPALEEALEEAENGRGDRLLALSDSYHGRDAEGRFEASSHAQRAVSCADDSSRPTMADAKAVLPEFEKVSPVFGPFLAWDTAGWCADWPVPGEREDPEASAEGAAPIVVVGTTGDPATPFEGAERMAKELGEDVGVLVTFDGEGHGAYFASDCVQDTVNAYLARGEVPRNGLTCEP